MKNLIFIGLLALGIVSCTKSTSTSVNNPIVTDTTKHTTDTSKHSVDTTKSSNDTTITLSGTLIPNPGESANGTVKILKVGNNYSLRLENFTATNGPDLHVYLAQETTPVHIIDLGKLKASTGSQTYSINGSPDFTKFKFATIHCQQYNVVFGYAALQ